MNAIFKFLIIYSVFFAIQVVTFAATEQMSSEELKAEKSQPGLCFKPQKKCDVRQLTQAEVDTAAAMADEVAFQLMQLDQEEKQAGRDFKVALIGRAGTDLGKFQVLKDALADGQKYSMSQLVTRLHQETDQMNMGRDGYFQGSAIDYQVLKDWMDKSRKMEYSHVGIALKNHEKSDKNYHWQIMHLLWTCGADPDRNVPEGDRSYIWEEGLGAVFADDMREYKAQIMVPQQEIQNRIEDFLLKSKMGAQWHNKKYNAAALSNDLDQQNSNQWVLEVLAASLKPVGQVNDRASAQKVLAETGYMETKVKPTGLYSLINLPFAKNFLPGTVCMNRQPYFKEGFGEIISVLSIEEYLRRNQMLAREPVIVQLPDDLNFVKQEKEKEKQK